MPVSFLDSWLVPCKPDGLVLLEQVRIGQSAENSAFVRGFPLAFWIPKYLNYISPDGVRNGFADCEIFHQSSGD